MKTIHSILACLIAALFISCSSQQQTLQTPPSNLGDCSAGGNGLLDSVVNVSFDNSSKEYNYWYPTDEYAPVISQSVNGNDTLWFTSSRAYYSVAKDKRFSKYELKQTNLPGEVFYSVRNNLDGKLAPQQGWSKPEMMKTGDGAFDLYTRGPMTKYGDYFIFTGEEDITGNLNAQRLGTSFNLNLWESYRSGGTFSKPQELGANVNSEKWESQPAFSKDGQTLYFVSNRPNPDMNNDSSLNIWYSKREGNSWGQAKPLNTINTPGDDWFPHCGVDGKFYFSSNWDYAKNSKSVTNFDIYVATIGYEGIPSMPVKFETQKSSMGKGYPTVNTIDNEISPFLSPDGKAIYFASDRKNGYTKYDLYSCGLPPGRINLTVNCTTESGSMLQKNGSGVSFRIDGGKFKNQIFDCGKTLDLEPKIAYKITPVVDKCLCNGKEIIVQDDSHQNEYTINTPDTYIGDMHYDREFKIACVIDSVRFTVGSANFVTGYWYPMTTENKKEYDRKVRSNFFSKKGSSSNFVNLKYDGKNKEDVKNLVVSTDKVFEDISQSLKSLIDQNKCLTTPDQIIQVTVTGYTDERGLSKPRFFPEQNTTIDAGKYTITTRQSMDDFQEGNVYLSLLRAHYTAETIENMMKNYPSFNDLKQRNKIKFKVVFRGIDEMVYDDKNPPNDERRRRVDVNIESGHITRVDTSQPEPPAGPYKWNPKWDTIPQADFIVEYNFKNREDAVFVRDVLNKYNDLKFTDIDSIDTHIFVFQSVKTYKSWVDANKEAVNSRKTTSHLASVLKQAWPNKMPQQNYEFAVSFGFFETKSLAKAYLKKLSKTGIDAKIKVKQSDKTYYDVRVSGYKTKDLAEKSSKKYLDLTKKARLWQKIEVIKINLNDSYD